MSSNQLFTIRHALEMWKKKAINRGRQVKELKKRLKELTSSRDGWKMKAKAHHLTIRELQAELKHLRKQETTPPKKLRRCPTVTVIASEQSRS